ncbi:MAG TPA: o-succinylbenzoate synthase [Propionibacteriaceae bacterium]
MPGPLHVYSIAMRTRFRGIEVREGVVWEGPFGWAEWSPFLDYAGDEIVPWLRAADEAADLGWPAPVRDAVAVNCTIAAVPPEEAFGLARDSGCRTAKVKVAEPGQRLANDVDRVAAVRAALGPSGRVRVDANGGWSVDDALTAVLRLARFDLEYVEQPCRTVRELADLRRRLARAGASVPVAADESIRRSNDPYRVAQLEAADIAVLKVQPLGGVQACLQIAQRIGMPVVVSSALETSIGIRAGLALAAALPELPYACGLNTVALLHRDLGAFPLVAVDGFLQVESLDVSTRALQGCAADPERTRFWQARLMHTRTRAVEEPVGKHPGHHLG